MRRLFAYTLYCVVILALFAFGRFYGRSLSDDLPDQSGSGSGGSGGGFFYTGTSGGSHK